MEWANSSEIVLVGWIGLIIFALLALYALINLYRSSNHVLTRLFFISSLLGSLLDLPRYIFLIIDREYLSLSGYSCHILSNYLFFLSLTLVCVVWSRLLASTPSPFKFLYKGYGVMVMNIILAIISLITFIHCLLSPSLSTFLDSIIYSIYIFFEVLVNLFYSIAVAFLGIKLVFRFQNYAVSSGKKNIVQTNAFRKALKKPYFRKYGLLWFLWSDFIPKGVATLAFLSLMASRTHHKHPGAGSKPSWASNLNELELEKSPNYEWNDDDGNGNGDGDDHGSDIIINPVNDFETSHEVSYPEESSLSLSVDDHDRHRQSSSSSFWESPTAAQDALNIMTKRPD